MENMSITLKKLHEVNHVIAELYNEEFSVYNRIINFLYLLMEVVYFDKGVVIFYYKDSQGVYHKHSSISTSWDDRPKELLRKYNDFYCTLDDTFQILDKPYPVLINSYEVFDNDQRQQTQYYREYLLPNNCIYSLDGNIQIKNDVGLKAAIALYRGDEKKNFSDMDYEIVRLLQIHLSNVLKDYGKEHSSTSFLSIIENYNCVGVCIIDENYEIIKHNKAFVKIAEAHSKDTTCKIKEMCMHIFKSEGKLEKISDEYKFEDSALFVEVNKINNSRDNRVQFCCLIYDLSYFVLKTLDTAKEKYMLTPREFEVIQELLRGKSNEDIAKSLYISIPSVKKILASVYDKMEIKNQKQIFNKLNLL